jgi:hypothetical protein
VPLSSSHCFYSRNGGAQGRTSPSSSFPCSKAGWLVPGVQLLDMVSLRGHQAQKIGLISVILTICTVFCLPQKELNRQKQNRSEISSKNYGVHPTFYK